MDLLEDKSCSDIIVEVNDKRYQLHKLILRRAEYFKTLFGSQFQDANSSIIRLSDISNQVFEFFIESIYTNSWNDKYFDSVLQLYEFSLRMQYETLSIHCLKSSISNIGLLMIMLGMNSSAWIKIKFNNYDFLSLNVEYVLSKLLFIDNREVVSSIINNLDNADIITVIETICNWCNRYKNEELWNNIDLSKCCFPVNFIRRLYEFNIFDKPAILNILKCLDLYDITISCLNLQIFEGYYQELKFLVKNLYDETSKEIVLSSHPLNIKGFGKISGSITHIFNKQYCVFSVQTVDTKIIRYIVVYKVDIKGNIIWYRKYDCHEVDTVYLRLEGIVSNYKICAY